MSSLSLCKFTYPSEGEGSLRNHEVAQVSMDNQEAFQAIKTSIDILRRHAPEGISLGEADFFADHLDCIARQKKSDLIFGYDTGEVQPVKFDALRQNLLKSSGKAVCVTKNDIREERYLFQTQGARERFEMQVLKRG